MAVVTICRNSGPFFFLSPSVKRVDFEKSFIYCKKKFLNLFSIFPFIKELTTKITSVVWKKKGHNSFKLFPLSSRVSSFTLNLGSLYEMLWPIEWVNRKVFLSLSFKGNCMLPFLSLVILPTTKTTSGPIQCVMRDYREMT